MMLLSGNQMPLAHACLPWLTSAESPCTTSDPMQSNRTNAASATPLEPVWVYARYLTTVYMLSVDAACVYECGGPTHDERRHAIKSQKCRLSDVVRDRVGACTLPNDQDYRHGCRYSSPVLHSDPACSTAPTLFSLPRSWGVGG
jgi:hypothetical protein